MKNKLPEDVLSITTMPPMAIDGSYLNKIWQMRADLNEQLMGNGKMPIIHPSSIHQPDYQSNLREYMGFMIEELSEAMEQYQGLHQFILADSNSDAKRCMETLKNYNEEISDVFHILLLVMDFSGIGEFELEEYFEQYCEEANLSASWLPKNTLQSYVDLGKFINGTNGRKYLMGHYHIEVKNESAFYRGGTYVSNQLTITHKELVYDIIHFTNLAKNQLKNKPWKSKHVAVNIPKYQQYLIEVWLRFFVYVDFIGHDARSLYEIFHRKNQVNLNRIKNNY